MKPGLVNQLKHLAELLANADNVLVLTGAGCSTASGIGDYRDAQGQWKRAAPVQHQDFMTSLRWRQRYWVRSMHGYPQFVTAQPNSAHVALAGLQQAGRVHGLITQNVDRLHQRAGHSDVIDLHGRLDRVRCMACDNTQARATLQPWLESHNRAFVSDEFEMTADGDANLTETDYSAVQVPHCQTCGGILKPDVVFYGDSVPRPVVDAAYTAVDQSHALLVVGSSLMVFSSFRFVRRAAEQAKPILAINDGTTRADELMTAKVSARCEEALPALQDLMVG